jgi:hypothetical protein
MTRWWFGQRRAGTDSATPPDPSMAREAWRDSLASGLRGATLCAFCASQVWLDRLASRPIFLATLAIDVLIAFAVVIGVLAPAVVAVALIGCRRTFVRGGDLIERAIVGVFLGLIAAIFWRRIPGIGWEIHLIATLATGVAAGWWYGRGTLPRRLAIVASPAILVFPLWFLASAAGPLLFGGNGKEVAAGPQATRPRNIVWIVLDECCGVSLMDANRGLNPHRVPNIAKLAEKWTWFRNGSSVHPRTDQAVPAMLTGRYPAIDRPPRAADHPGNLFELLRATGQYDFVVFEPFTQVAGDIATDRGTRNPADLSARLALCLSTVARVWAHDLCPEVNPYELPSLPNDWFGAGRRSNLTGDERSGTIRYAWDMTRRTQVEHFLKCLTPRERPTAFFLHIALPHYPWLYRPSGKLTSADVGIGFHAIIGGEGPFGEQWTDDVDTVDRNYQAYLAQLGYADKVVGDIVRRLEKTGLYEDCVFVLTGDHGVSFRPSHARRLADNSTLADIMSVPMFVKRPKGDSVRIDDSNAETIDLLPTVLSEIGLADERLRDGSNLFADGRIERPIKRFRREGSGFHEIPATFEGRWESLADLLGRMGDGTTAIGYPKGGPGALLRGRRADEFATSDAADIRCFVRSPSNINHDPDGEFFPGWFDGLLSGNIADLSKRVFALAVNGTIVATGRAGRDLNSESRFGAYLPDDVIVPGRNRFDLYFVAGTGDSTRLERIPFVDVSGKVTPQPGP